MVSLNSFQEEGGRVIWDVNSKGHGFRNTSSCLSAILLLINTPAKRQGRAEMSFCQQDKMMLILGATADPLPAGSADSTAALLSLTANTTNSCY